GTDEDTFLTPDPLTNLFDLGADVIKFSEDRMRLSEELLKALSTRVVDNGEGYQRARVAFSILLSQYGNGAYLISKYVGGEHAHRDHRGDPSARDPLTPVTPAKQREALKFLQENLFSDKAFNFPPELLRNLQREHIKKLSSLVLGEKPRSNPYMYYILFGDGDFGGTAAPPDARSLARTHLREIGDRIKTMLADRQVNTDETTLAHLEEC